jgi:SAM-dependent methyltransferase
MPADVIVPSSPLARVLALRVTHIDTAHHAYHPPFSQLRAAVAVALPSRPTMSTQYDSIGTAYNDLKTLPSARMERINVRDAVAPYVKGARVLDLACGTGYYTRALLEWGAVEVVGLDISAEMVKAAREATTPAAGQKCSFAVGDASEPFQLASTPFDLVLGVWLLNYAPSAAVMAKMWANIAHHLRPGGVFVGMMPPPESGIEAVRKNIEDHRGPKNGVMVEIVQEVLDGYKTRFVMRRGEVNFEFENYHLVKEVYQRSARQGGMQGSFRWRPMQLPHSEEEVKQLSAGLAEGFWDNYFTSPHCGMCVVER